MEFITTGGLQQHYISNREKLKRKEGVLYLQTATHVCIYVNTCGHHRCIFKYEVKVTSM